MATRDEDGRRITIKDRTDKWRLECPEGHRDWVAINGYLACRTCRDHHPDVDDHRYRQLRDQRSGQLVSREQIEIEPLR